MEISRSKCKRFIWICLGLYALIEPLQLHAGWYDYYPPERTHPWLHLGLSQGATIGSFYLLSKTKPELSHGKRILLSTGFGLLPGLMKEGLDYYTDKSFGIKDMFYNSLGVFSGLAISLQF